MTSLRAGVATADYGNVLSAIPKWELRISLTTITFEQLETDSGLYVDITGTRSTGDQSFSLMSLLS